MMKLFLRMPYYLHPEPAAARAPIILFLHGLGEGFVNHNELGHRNLFKQGPPKHLELLDPGHPLRAGFTLIAPQLPDRETSWADVAPDLQNILVPYRADGSELNIVGFSKGGLGAFQVARQLKPRALLTIDASPMGQDPKAAFDQWVKPLDPKLPFWAIHTRYAQGERFRKIQEFNELLVTDASNQLEPAPVGERVRTSIAAPAGLDPVRRHGWLCDAATKGTAPFEWLLKQ